MVHAIAPTVSLVFHAWEYSYVRHCPQEGVDGVSAEVKTPVVPSVAQR